MSQYPPYGYGRWPPPPVPPPQEYSPTQGYTPSNAPADHAPGNAFGNYNAISQRAFAYNATQIPGLGITGSPAPGAQHGWGQMAPDPVTSAGVPQYQIPPQYSGGFHQHNSRHYAPPPLDNSSKLPPAEIVRTRNQDDGMEEGELSEDDFENLYEPAEPAEPTNIATTSTHDFVPQPDTPASRGVSIIDVQDDAFYEDDPGEINLDADHPTPAKPADLAVGQSSHQQKAPTTRARSGSYSPYLSTREIHLEDRAVAAKLDTAIEGDSSNMANTSTQGRPGVALLSPFLAGTITGEAKEQPLQQLASVVKATVRPLPARTLEEAKKDAQKAILRLVSMGVSYQTYIDEGFDPKVIASLFNDLGLNASSNTPQNNGPTKSSDSTEKIPLQPPPQQQSSGGSSVAMNQQEERKDRIARLLAAKAAKSGSMPSAPALSSATSTPSAPSASAAPTALPPTREKAKSEKDLLLQRKMEALQKSRNDRAAQAAKIPVSTDSLTLADNGAELRPAEQGQPSPSATGGQRLSQSSVALQRDSSATPAPASGQSTPSIAELPQPPIPQPTRLLSNVRKRPVAADFVDYSSTVGSTKRPFGLGRQDSSLVIDISDGSDEEDVEMDMDSLVGGPSLNRRHESPTRNGLSIRDFPPLTDLAPRNYASSASSVPTPPNGAGKDDEYSKKIKAIEEMKRKIAEAEKRKASKTPVGMRTPNKALELREDQGFGLPPIRRVSAGDAGKDGSPSGQLLTDVAAVELPQSSELRGTPSSSKEERRSRISSLQLPNVEATLQQKVAEMQLMQEKMSHLQTEIDDALSAKKQLTEELEELGDEYILTSPHPDSPQPPTTEHHNSNDLGNGNDETSSAKKSLSPHGTSEASEGPQPDAGSIHSQSDEPSGEVANETMPAGLDDVATTLDDARTPPAGANEPAIHDSPRPSDEAMEMDIARTPPAGANEPTIHDSPSPSDEAMEMDDADNATPESAYPDAPLHGGGLIEEGEVDLPEVAEVAVPPGTDSLAVASVANKAADESGLQDSGASLVHVPVSTSGTTAHDKSLEEVGQTREAGNISAVADTLFTPYVSPLQYFRSYRFHPAFKDSVQGGLKSLTYSSKIDPRVEICPSDLEGQECPNGPSCQYQHFKSMTASENDLLVELSNSSDLRGEENARFIQGLKGVLQKARSDNVRDFDTIAYNIIEFRRQFLGDPSRVLTHLGGISI